MAETPPTAGPRGGRKRSNEESSAWWGDRGGQTGNKVGSSAAAGAWAGGFRLGNDGERARELWIEEAYDERFERVDIEQRGRRRLYRGQLRECGLDLRFQITVLRVCVRGLSESAANSKLLHRIKYYVLLSA